MNTVLLTHADGVDLAIELLRELEAEDAPSRCALEARHRPTGAPQDVVVLRYLQALRESGPDAEKGFAAVLSDFIASALDGAVLSAGNYKAIVDNSA